MLSKLSDFSARLVLSGYAVCSCSFVAVMAPTSVQGEPLGNEFQVNTTTENDQVAPDVASDAAGNFIVVFQTFEAPGTGANVLAQRYDFAGRRLGGEFQVNTTANSDVTFPAIAMAPAGDFVVAWQDFGDDGSGTGVFAQRYNAAGQAQGANIPVNTTTQGQQHRANVAMANDARFVVVWEDATAGNSKRGIRGQRFDASGNAQGSEFDISTDPDIDHTYPQVAMDSLGNFVVGWSAGNVGANQDVVFRRFDLNGLPLGGPAQVNVTSRMDSASGVVNNMSIDADAHGNFVVAWQAVNFTGPGVPGASIGILARRYDSNGNALGARFEVNTNKPSGAPEVDVLPNGEFAIAYEAPDGSLSGVAARIYSSDGRPVEPAFRYNTTTPLVQDRPAIALDRRGRGVIVWRAKQNQDGDRDGVFARLLKYNAGTFNGNRVLRTICLAAGTCQS